MCVIVLASGGSREGDGGNASPPASHNAPKLAILRSKWKKNSEEGQREILLDPSPRGGILPPHTHPTPPPRGLRPLGSWSPATSLTNDYWIRHWFWLLKFAF